MNTRGHNERSFRLDTLAQEAREGLKRIEEGEEFTIGGWLAYGHALNEGRALFKSDREYGEWVQCANLAQWNGQEIDRHDRAAAMWAAANADQFDEARQRGNPRTIRGIHAKWKEIEAERAIEEYRIAQEAREAEAKAQATPPQEVVSETPAPQQSPPPQAVHAEQVSGGADGTPAAPATNTQPEQEVDPYGYAGLTHEALLETANGLHADLVDAKAKVSALNQECENLKAKLREATEGDLGRNLGNVQRQRDTVKGRLQEELAKNARQTRRIKHLEAERDKLQRQIEGQEITL